MLGIILYEHLFGLADYALVIKEVYFCVLVLRSYLH